VSGSADRPVALSAAGLRGRSGFAGDVAALAPRIRHASRICNLLSDRYAYLVGIAAAMANGQTTVLPASTAPDALAAALEASGEVIALGDAPGLPAAVPRIALSPEDAPDGDWEALSAAMTARGAMIEVFTSGSTGHPVRHRKRWETLAGGAAVTGWLFARAGLEPGHFAVLGTVPHQHMYGLEALAFATLTGGACLYRAPAFYPGDLEAAGAAARAAGIRSLALVTSPAHLRYLEGALDALPGLALVISATSPLPLPLAERVEVATGAAVWEIYGSTETGSLAVRRPTRGELWTPLAGFRLTARPEGTEAAAPHLDQPVLLGDALRIEDDGRFTLEGRIADMVNVAGKRASLGGLGAILAETPGLADAAMLAERGPEGDRLVAVAALDPGSGLDEAGARAAIRRQLLRHVDPIFLPRRVLFLAALPRTATGKLSAAERERLLSMAG